MEADSRSPAAAPYRVSSGNNLLKLIFRRHSGTLQHRLQRICDLAAYAFLQREASGEQVHQTGATSLIVCVTCTERWGQLAGLRSWQDHCPCYFSEAHPNGLVDVGITAQVHSKHHER